MERDGIYGTRTIIYSIQHHTTLYNMCSIRVRIGAGENGRPTNSIIIYRINFIAEVDMNKCLTRG